MKDGLRKLGFRFAGQNRSSRILFFSLALLTACADPPVPKPSGYFRIDLPKEIHYQLVGLEYPFSFEFPSDTHIADVKSDNPDDIWINIEYPKINGKLHLSYMPLKGNFKAVSEDARVFVYKHTVRADAINETVFRFPKHHVSGILFRLEGNSASALQFVASDSSKHFLRGALYFNCPANRDSIQPLVTFIERDVLHLIETLTWK